MKILEAEIGLRDETRVLEQVREVTEADDYERRGRALADEQDALASRVATVITTLREHQQARSFGKEIALLTRVGEIMGEVTALLARPATGPETIAAETEIIELLLQARRSNGGGGGGGGSSPGGGGVGRAAPGALASLGDDRTGPSVARSRAVQQATGVTGDELPAEFRAGLDAYFNGYEGGGR